MKVLNINKLAEIQELNKVGAITLNLIQVLLNSINDWPNSIERLEDFELEVRTIIGGEVIHKRLEIFLSKIDLSRDAWQAESLSQLLDIFNFYDNEISLREILIDLKQKLEDEKLI
jgi:hypothetical protein